MENIIKKVFKKNSILFNKSQRDYIIIDKFNVIDSILIIINNNNILSSLIINNNDFDNYKYYYKMKNIIDNIREVKARQNERMAAAMFIGVNNNEDIDAIYNSAKLNHVHAYADMLEKIETLPTREDIHAFLRYNSDFEPLSEYTYEPSTDSDSDRVFGSFEIQNSEEDQPILTTKQQE